MADGLLPEELGPLAATGELDADGRTVRPVLGLVTKMKAWRERFPEGTIVTGPLGTLEEEAWKTLVGRGHSFTVDDDVITRWFTGGSMAELAAKLNEPAPPLKHWDDTDLDEGGIAALNLEWGSATARDTPLRDPLLDATWAASQQGTAPGGRRGVIIQGPPGSGKSTLSRLLERRFRSGPLGALGFGVRRAAREVAEDQRRSSARTWSALLALREPKRSELFEELERTGRLVPIVDGLDELGGAQLQEVSALLQRHPGWWVATSRPIADIGAVFPPAWSLQVKDLSSHEGHKLLSGLGRSDLAELLHPTHAFVGRSLPHSLVALTKTPLHLALLAKVTRPGEHPERSAAHELYHRVFQGLLTQSCRDERLSEQEARLLRALQANTLGELALNWLRSPTGYLDGASVDLALDDAGFKAVDRPHVVRALEFGHLLAPAGDAWEFAHRTIAEWVAAGALHRQVLGRLQAHARRAGRPSDRIRRASIELKVLAPFLETRVLANRGPWVQLLLFYAPHIVEPLALLDRLVGPAARSSWLLPDEEQTSPRATRPRVTSRPALAGDVLGAWDLAFRLLCLAHWERPEDARIAWAIAVRRWLLFEHVGESSYGREQVSPRLKDFSSAVAGHLPTRLSDLISLVVRTDAQREQLHADPTLVLPAIPPTHATTLEPLLRGRSRKNQLAVLEWYAEHGLEVDGALLDELLQRLPEEVAQAEAEAQALGKEDHHAWSYEAPHPTIAHRSMLHRLEELVWETSLRTRRKLPWALVRSRLLGWPRHLEKVLLRWFSEPTEERAVGASEGEVWQRREVLARSINEANRIAGRIVDELRHWRTEPDGPLRIGSVWYFFDDSDDRHFRYLFTELATKAGWDLSEKCWSSSTRAAEAVQAIERLVKQLYQLKHRVTELLGALGDTHLEPVAGTLWELLPPDHPDREELLAAIDNVDRPPPQVPASLLLERREYNFWRMEQIVWTPTHLEQLRELAATGEGERRLVAVLLLAHLEKRDETTSLLQLLPTTDARLADLIRSKLEGRMTRETQIPTEFLPPSALAQLPLEFRAEKGVPGWRAELIARLAESDQVSSSLVELAVRHGVHEALPLLARQLTGHTWSDHSLIKAIIGLCTEADAHWARVALLHALRHGWPYTGAAGRRPRFDDEQELSPDDVALARYLTLEDLDVLAQGTVSALDHPSLAEAIRGLGPEARERLFAHYRRLAQQVAALERSAQPQERRLHLLGRPDADPLTWAQQLRDALAQTLVASFDRARGRLTEVVNLAFQVAGGDVHHVYSMTGPLGSDFDEPADLDWYSDQDNAALLENLSEHIEACLSHEPEAWPELRRLFVHPSETLRQRAFEFCADRAAPHQVAELALEALEGHARANRTRWRGNTLGLTLARMQRGAGTAYVDSPDTVGRLVEAVRRRLMPAHRKVIETLVGHELPIFRALAARWAGQIGSATWLEFLIPLLRDPDARVVRSAFDAILSLAPERLDEALRQTDGQAWTSLHDIAVLQGLKPPKPRRPRRWLSLGDEHTPVDPRKYVSATTLELLIVRAAERPGQPPGEERPLPTPFDDFPSLVDQLCTSYWRVQAPSPGTLELLRRWSHHERPRIRLVARRLRAAHRDLTREEVLPLLSGEASDRVSAAECLVRLGDETHREECSAIWEAGLGSWEKRGGLGQLDPFEGALRDRLVWALKGATPAFASLLELLVRHIPYDHQEAADTPEGERLVKQTRKIIQRWGKPGIVALVDLIDAKKVEDHPDFMRLVKTAVRRRRSLYELLQGRAAESNATAQRVLDELREEQERRDLTGLAVRLAAEVFPKQWPHRDDAEP
jgi:hypothetical protein